MIDERHIAAFKRWNDPVIRDLSSEHRREVNKVVAKVSSGKSTIVIGPRGVGKSSILNDVSITLEKAGKKTCTIDLDDPSSAGITTENILELLEIEGFFRADGEKYLVVHELRRLLEFEKLVNILKKNEIFTTASVSASVDSARLFPEHFELVDVNFPSFPDYINKITDKTVDIQNSREFFDGYIRFKYKNYKQIRRYRAIDTIVRTLNDIVFFNEVRDFRILNDISVYLVSSPAKEISATSLRRRFSCSIDMMRALLSHIEGSGLVSLVKRIEDRERPSQASRLCIPNDIVMSLEFGASDDAHSLALVAVYRELKKIYDRVYSIKIKDLLGFCLHEKTGPVPIFSLFVSYPYGFERIFPEIRMAAARLGQSKIIVLSADDEPHDETIKGCVLHVRPIWSWALMPMAEVLPTDIKVHKQNAQVPNKKISDGSGSPPANDSMPSHLL
ncbi:MAG: ATP-binding protein [Myxococcales bacterium]|nr:ATP-binding protein [Myxococcales bacterium]